MNSLPYLMKELNVYLCEDVDVKYIYIHFDIWFVVLRICVLFSKYDNHVLYISK